MLALVPSGVRGVAALLSGIKHPLHFHSKLFSTLKLCSRAKITGFYFLVTKAEPDVPSQCIQQVCSLPSAPFQYNEVLFEKFPLALFLFSPLSWKLPFKTLISVFYFFPPAG